MSSKINPFRPKITYSLLLSLWFFSCNDTQKEVHPVEVSLEYQPWESTEKPEGNAAYLGLGSYAKVFCTAVFESNRAPEEAFQNSRGLLLDPDLMDQVIYQIDSSSVTLSLGDSMSRTATYVGDQGCILDINKGLHFPPTEVITKLPPAQELAWPMGDQVSGPQPNDSMMADIVEAAFSPEALTAAFLVVYNGEIIVEEYRDGISKDTQLESWSMGKSLTGTLIGRLIQQNRLSLDQKAPIKEWSRKGDPRGEITIRNLMQMSSGLRFPSHHDPKVLVPLPLLEHMYVYTGSTNIFDFVVNRPLEFIPGSTGRYRNTDPLSLGYIFRQTVEADGKNYWTWPQEELFDKIGIRRQLLETDRWGNFIMSGYDYGTARNWARIGLLYLNDGVWGSERLLPEGFVDFVSTPAPGWEQPIYGAMVWINGTGENYPSLPESTFAFRGGGGQNTIVVPDMDLVVVRMGHSRGGPFVQESLNQALELLVQAIESMD